jgi:hypothetical protein
MTLQDISDKVEINELLARYCHALDEKDWHSFQAIFLSDAILDFTALVDPKALLPSCKNFLYQSLAAWPRHSTQSLPSKLIWQEIAPPPDLRPSSP